MSPFHPILPQRGLDENKIPHGFLSFTLLTFTNIFGSYTWVLDTDTFRPMQMYVNSALAQAELSAPAISA